MAALEPADSGGFTGTTQAIDSILHFEAKGSWAQMMEEEEEKNEALAAHDTLEKELDPVIASKLKNIPSEPPYFVQVTNIPNQFNSQEEALKAEEELFYFFGADDALANAEIKHELGKARLTFKTRAALIQALEKHDTKFGGRVIKVFVERSVQARPQKQNYEQFGSEEEHGRAAAGGYKGGDSRNYFHGRDNHYEDRGYHRNNNSHYSSQSSMNDNRSDYNYRHRGGGGYNNDYRGGRDDRRFSNNRQRGGRNDRGSYGGDGRNSYQQHEFQRSNSHQQYGNRDYPAPINRSRTDSNYYERDSRAQSRMSEDVPAPQPVIKKPSVNPFGNAKPVDTQAKLQELERRMAEKEKMEKEAAQREAERLAKEQAEAAAAAAAPEEFTETDGQNHRRSFPMKEFRKNQHHQQGPGSVQIRKRESERDTANASPPNDPIQHPVGDGVVAEESTPQSADSAHQEGHPQPPHHHQHQRHNFGSYGDRGGYSGRGQRPPRGTVHSLRGGILQRSATAGNIGVDVAAPVELEESSRGGFRGRGRGRGSSYQDRRDMRRVSISNISEKAEKEPVSRKTSGHKRGTFKGKSSSSTGARVGESQSARESIEVPQAQEVVPVPTPPAPMVEQSQQEEREPEQKKVEEQKPQQPEQELESSKPPTPKKKEKKRDSKKKQESKAKLQGNRFAALHGMIDTV